MKEENASISLCDVNNASEFPPWPPRVLPLGIVVQLVPTVTAAFHLQPPKGGRCQVVPPLLFMTRWVFLHRHFLRGWNTWWRVREKREDPSEMQEHCVSSCWFSWFLPSVWQQNVQLCQHWRAQGTNWQSTSRWHIFWWNDYLFAWPYKGRYWCFLGIGRGTEASISPLTEGFSLCCYPKSF